MQFCDYLLLGMVTSALVNSLVDQVDLVVAVHRTHRCLDVHPLHPPKNSFFIPPTRYLPRSRDKFPYHVGRRSLPRSDVRRAARPAARHQRRPVRRGRVRRPQRSQSSRRIPER